MTSRRVFTEELEKLDYEVAQMARLAVEAIEKGVRAFVKMDKDLMNEVEQLDVEIYCWDIRIEKHCLDVIALHAPVASDLRTVSTCLKIITDLNRIGRYALDIAEFTENFHDQTHFKKLVSIPFMGEKVVAMVTQAVESYVHRNAEEAQELYDKDDEVDHLWESILRETLSYMMEDPRKTTLGTYYILVARYLERIADHSVNIGERVAYMVTGKRLKARDWTQICAEPDDQSGK
ncbi:MAG: phosphate signaling complex protein PhoU [Methanomassiliicoccales archaeon]|nr:phosphate signaling complex protein PhoU [Methanomassiliicoccales archaeon]NYT14530.1 phosphate signaling complex protein PhoU [Methanomassiliicoccales archaeon]